MMNDNFVNEHYSLHKFATIDSSWNNSSLIVVNQAKKSSCCSRTFICIILSMKGRANYFTPKQLLRVCAVDGDNSKQSEYLIQYKNINLFS